MLWPFRLGKNPWAPKRTLTEEEREALVTRLKHARLASETLQRWEVLSNFNGPGRVVRKNKLKGIKQMKLEFDDTEILKEAIKEIIQDEYDNGFTDVVYEIAKSNPEWWAETVVEPYIAKAFEKAFKDKGAQLLKACVDEMFEEWAVDFEELVNEELRKAAAKFVEEKVKGMLK